MVKVGNSECVLVKRTPSAISAVMRGRRPFVHHAGPQPVGHEQHDIVQARRRLGRGRRAASAPSDDGEAAGAFGIPQGVGVLYRQMA